MSAELRRWCRLLIKWSCRRRRLPISHIVAYLVYAVLLVFCDHMRHFIKWSSWWGKCVMDVFKKATIQKNATNNFYWSSNHSNFARWDIPPLRNQAGCIGCCRGYISNLKLSQEDNLKQYQNIYLVSSGATCKDHWLLIPVQFQFSLKQNEAFI